MTGRPTAITQAFGFLVIAIALCLWWSWASHAEDPRDGLVPLRDVGFEMVRQANSE